MLIMYSALTKLGIKTMYSVSIAINGYNNRNYQGLADYEKTNVINVGIMFQLPVKFVFQNGMVTAGQQRAVWNNYRRPGVYRFTTSG